MKGYQQWLIHNHKLDYYMNNVAYQMSMEEYWATDYDLIELDIQEYYIDLRAKKLKL